MADDTRDPQPRIGECDFCGGAHFNRNCPVAIDAVRDTLDARPSGGEALDVEWLADIIREHGIGLDRAMKIAEQIAREYAALAAPVSPEPTDG